MSHAIKSGRGSKSFAKFQAFRPARQRLGLRQPSAAFTSSDLYKDTIDSDNAVGEALLPWYRKNARDLPWRRLLDGTGKLVARYDESDNRTRTREGRIVGDGDQRLRALETDGH
jgi:hypothetical protein